MEQQRSIFFSSDLMIQSGQAKGAIVDGNWQNEANNIRPEQVPDPQRLNQLQETLAQLNPRLVATGHGPCLKLR